MSTTPPNTDDGEDGNRIRTPLLPPVPTSKTALRTRPSQLTRMPLIHECWYPEDLVLLSYVELQRLHVLLYKKMNFIQDYVDDLKAQIEHEEKIKKKA
jgi:hypothetical protein